MIEEYNSIYRGYVLDNVDKTQSGLVQVIVPFLSDSPLVNWASPKSGRYGSGTGSLFVPDKGCPVFIEFELGNPDYPVYTPAVWDDLNSFQFSDIKDLTYDSNGNPIGKIIKTKSGYIRFLDKTGSEEIELVNEEVDEEGLSKSIFSKFRQTKLGIYFSKFLNKKKVSEIFLTDSSFTVIIGGSNIKSKLVVEKEKVTMEIPNVCKLEMANSGVTLEAGSILLKGETKINGVIAGVTPGLCSIPICPFTGASHTIDKAGMK